jgi:hypothetical protein
VDDRRPTSPRHQVCEPIGSDAAPITQNVQRESALIVYCGTDQQISEGFAIALRIMGLDANFLPVGIAPATDGLNAEDN